jgi:hypothetical protein
LEECVNIYKDNGILYLKSSLRGEENIWDEELRELW